MGPALEYLARQHPWFWMLLGGVLGAVAGSFLNCLRYRWPRGLSLRHPAYSYCPSCKHQLAVPDLIPLLSWLWLRGRCRYCHKPIGTTSFWLEAATTLTGILLAYAILKLLHF